VLVLPTAGLISALVNEARDLASGQGGSVQTWLDPAHPTTGPAIRWIEQYVSLNALRSPRLLAQTIERRGGDLASRTLSVVGDAVGIVIRVFLVMFTAFFLFRDGERLRARAARMPLLRNPEVQRLVTRTREVVEASVLGTLAVAGLQGALGGLAFLVLGLPSPVLWGTAMALLSIIPMLGAFVVWIPAAVVLALSGAWVKALLLTVWGTFVIGLADNILRPMLVGNRARVHELVVFFGVLGGLEVFGVLGVVLGPVILTALPALVSSVRRLTTKARRKEEVRLVTTG
jgi:predicted PurR-regulated permease PerM